MFLPINNCSRYPNPLWEYWRLWINKCQRYIREAIGLAYDILVEENAYSVGA